MKRPPDSLVPTNINAERTILGSILLECSCAERPEWIKQWNIATALDPDDFMLDSHRRIFLRMDDLIEAGSQVDIVTLSEELAKHKEVEIIGGVAYLSSLTEGLPRRPRILDYVKIVKAKSLKRKLIFACSAALESAYDGTPGLEVIEKLKEQIAEIEASARRGIRHAK